MLNESKFRVPLGLVELTTVQRDSLAVTRGMSIFNITTNQSETYNGTAWIGSTLLTTYIKAGIITFVASVVPVSTKVGYITLESETIYETDAPQSKCTSLVAPSAVTVLDIRRITSVGTDTSLGSITFGSGSLVGVVSMTGVTLPSNDTIYVLSPNNTNGMEDLFINLTGKSLIPVY
jgi:hypothetical protein